jgi:murein DD-endopeptidase MepM/ murein hydrolase activator NlpD
MQVIIISSKSHRQWHLSKRKVLIGLSLLMTIVATSAINMSKWFDSTQQSEHFSPSYLSLNSENALTPDYNAFIEAREQNIQDYYAKQLGGLQAETIRLRMLSERLAEVAGFDTSAFSLDEHPAQGGLDWEGASLTSETLERGIDALSDELRSQQDVLSSLEQYILTKDTIFGSIPTGKPVDSGWVSSFYGYRIDPFNGKKTFHQGIDIAGKVGSEVHAVAEGIVTWVGNRGGYGSLVEVDHGNGYVTRYAHNEEVTVEKGQRVSRGDTLALMGSTGRSTGPHVHFEVLRDGRHVNPYNFIK